MKSGFLRIFPILAVGLFLQVSLLRADDRIDYRDAKDRSKVNIANGTIVDETFTAIKLKSTVGGKELTIPVADIVRLSYQLPGAANLEASQVTASEDKQDYPKALEGYKGILGKVGANERAKRHVEYKIAMLGAAVAADTPATTPAAIDAMKKFINTNTTSWHTATVAKQLISLQLKSGDAGGAMATADTWAKIDKLPKESKLEADTAKVEILFQTGKFKEAKGKAEEVVKDMPAADPAKAKLELYTVAGRLDDQSTKVADVAKSLEDLIAKSNDNSFKAACYNVLGDCYFAKGQVRDAMWSYLWVDVVYNQDRNEHVKALDRLVKVFEAPGTTDAERAKQFKEKLAKMR